MTYPVKTFNRYDYFIIALLGSIVFGTFGGFLQPVRILSILFLPIVVYEFNVLYQDRLVRRIIFFFFFWYIYCVLSVLWTSDPDQAFKELLYYPIHFNLFLSLVLFAKLANRPIYAIILGWCLFVFLSLPIAFNEIIANEHLESSKYGDKFINLGKGKSVLKHYAAVTFYNYNTYNTVLCFSFPFLLTYLLLFKRKILQFAGWVLVLSVLYIVLTNASRGTFISMGIMLVIFSVFFRKHSISYKPMLYFLLIGVVGYIIWVYGDVLFKQFGYRMIGRDSILTDQSRFGMILIVLAIVVDDLFMGAGTGSLIATFSQRSSIEIPHNLFLEILIQYGLIITIGILFFLCFLLKRAWKTRDNEIKLILFAALFPLPFISTINSGYLLMPSVWLFFASLFMVSKYPKY